LDGITIFKNFLEHQEAANASPYQEDPYLSPCENFKLIAYMVQELWCSKVVVANCDVAGVVAVAAAAVAGHCLSRVPMF
jgi:hypothetical protein